MTVEVRQSVAERAAPRVVQVVVRRIAEDVVGDSPD